MKICPYLGKVDDQETPVLFPSEMNGCYRGKRVVVPEFLHQETFCLSGLCGECPAFIDDQASENIPILRIPEKQEGDQRRKKWVSFFLVIIILGFLLLLIAMKDIWFPRSIVPPVQANTSSNITAPVLASFTPEIIPTLTVTMTVTVVRSKATIIPSLVPVMTFGTPIGADPAFVIYLLRAGDNFTKLAAEYNTSAEAISMVNYDLQIPLQEGRVIVIPVGVFSIDAEIPVFEAYQVDSEGKAVNDLAQELNANLEQLLSFNHLSLEQTLPKGTWLLIPRQRE